MTSLRCRHLDRHLVFTAHQLLDAVHSSSTTEQLVFPPTPRRDSGMVFIRIEDPAQATPSYDCPAVGLPDVVTQLTCSQLKSVLDLDGQRVEPPLLEGGEESTLVREVLPDPGYFRP